MAAGKRKTTRKSRKKKQTDAEMLEDLLQAIHEKLKSDELTPKIGDFLKVLEMKYKLKLSEDGRDKLLDLIETVRREELKEGDIGDDEID